MKYLLDTNTWSYYLRNKDEALVDRVEEALGAGELLLSVIVLAELEYGAEKAQRAGMAGFRRRVESLAIAVPPEQFTAAAAGAYGHIRADLEIRGVVIGPVDLLIAAHAIAVGAAVVTHNTREFARVPRLRVEDWQTAA